MNMPEDKIKGENGWDQFESSMSCEGTGTVLKIRIDFNRNLIRRWAGKFKPGMSRDVWMYNVIIDTLFTCINDATKMIVSGKQ